jgi:hypothetical protein
MANPRLQVGPLNPIAKRSRFPPRTLSITVVPSQGKSTTLNSPTLASRAPSSSLISLALGGLAPAHNM